MARLTIAAIGCGARTHTYASLIARHQTDRFEVVAAADPRPERVEAIRRFSQRPDRFLRFDGAKQLFDRKKVADIAIIGTQDADHREHAVAALERGYDLLLEKPIATSLEDVLLLAGRARELGRRVMICHVLRFAPAYVAIKSIVNSGELGHIRSVNATEGIGPWHFAHSYVRGHWSQKASSSPLILAKSCHDLDIILWLLGEKCVSVSSIGSLSFFNNENCPVNAPPVCTDGCPHADRCFYNAERYADRERKWLALIRDEMSDASEMESAKVLRWLTTSPWGRCVYQCGNDQPDHQTAQFEFSQGQTATFTVTAFATGRTLELCGTQAVLRARIGVGSETSVTVEDHSTGTVTSAPINCRPQSTEGYDEHGGGDFGLVSNLYQEMTTSDPADMTTGIAGAVESHIMAFAAEESRLTGKTIQSSLQRHFLR